MSQPLPRFKQPKEMYLLALTEMCQRFAFWGVGNLLVLYLVQYQKFTDASADKLFGIFTGIAFVLPVVGGYIADRLNYRLPVISGIILTSIGCFLIASGNLTMLYIALCFIAVGGSIFTPSIYALLGSLYRNQHHLRDSGFSIYYSAVNIGVFLAMILLGAIGQAHSWNMAFLIAGLIQLLGLIPFHKALKTFDVTHITPSHFTSAKQPSAPLHSYEKERIWVICILSFFSILFWIAYNQGGSSMNLFALNFTNRSIGSFQMPPSWLLSSESLYLLILAFPLAKLYTHLAKKHKDPTPPMKSVISLVMMGLCFLVMVIGSSSLPKNATAGLISPFYLLIAYAFMALGEMLIAPIGLSLITHLSPHRFTAMLVGVWYLCIGVAFYLGGIIAPWMSRVKEMSHFFSIFVVISFVFALLLLLLVKKLNKMRHLNHTS
ncbi:MAG: peptide MFS transporter [Chlamydiota bacterium]